MVSEAKVKVILINELGLHARAAALFVKTASKFVSDITVCKNGHNVSGRSLTGLIMLTATKGTTLDIIAIGEDAFKWRFEAGLPHAELILCESDYVEALAGEKKKGEFPPMSHDEMTAAYPGTYQSLLQLVPTCGECLSGELEAHKEHTK